MNYKSGPEVELTIKEYTELPRANAGTDLLVGRLGQRHLIMALDFIPLVAERTGQVEVTFHLVKWASNKL